MGVAVGDFNNDGFVDIYRTGLNGAVLLRNNGNGTFTDVTKASRRRGSRRLGRVGDVLRLRPRRLARSVRRQLPDLQRRRRHPVPERDGPPRLLSAEQLSRAAEPSVSQSRQRDVRGRHGEGAGRRRVRTGARRLDRRLQQRRLDRSLRRQRRQAEPALDQPAQRHVQGHRVSRRRGRERHRAGRGEHGRRRRRHRQRRRRGSDRHQLARSDERALRERRQPATSRIAAPRPASARRAWRRPDSAPAGSTSIATAGSICSSPTAASRRSRRRPARTIRFR